jgi:hypothetical protein
VAESKDDEPGMNQRPNTIAKVQTTITLSRHATGCRRQLLRQVCKLEVKLMCWCLQQFH